MTEMCRVGVIGPDETGQLCGDASTGTLTWWNGEMLPACDYHRLQFRGPGELLDEMRTVIGQAAKPVITEAFTRLVREWGGVSTVRRPIPAWAEPRPTEPTGDEPPTEPPWTCGNCGQRGNTNAGRCPRCNW